ncbi:MAG: adenosylmethionine decarboxylase [Minisyncoccia bacterium]
MQYGKHLLVEAITKNPKGLDNSNFIKGLFKNIVRAVKMKAVLPTTIYKFPQHKKSLNTASGLTAFCIVAESHLSIHTWPENNYFAFDLFSCRNFDEKKVISIIKNSFSVKKIHFKTIDRGISINF